MTNSTFSSTGSSNETSTGGGGGGSDMPNVNDIVGQAESTIAGEIRDFFYRYETYFIIGICVIGTLILLSIVGCILGCTSCCRTCTKGYTKVDNKESIK